MLPLNFVIPLNNVYRLPFHDDTIDQENLKNKISDLLWCRDLTAWAVACTMLDWCPCHTNGTADHPLLIIDMHNSYNRICTKIDFVAEKFVKIWRSHEWWCFIFYSEFILIYEHCISGLNFWRVKKTLYWSLKM